VYNVWWLDNILQVACNGFAIYMIHAAQLFHLGFFSLKITNKIVLKTTKNIKKLIQSIFFKNKEEIFQKAKRDLSQGRSAYGIVSLNQFERYAVRPPKP
jgi:hypothetical protein